MYIDKYQPGNTS